jgi:hypothetical protein
VTPFLSLAPPDQGHVITLKKLPNVNPDYLMKWVGTDPAL